jgi:O-antigen/teichoic acid export membrane protein
MPAKHRLETGQPVGTSPRVRDQPALTTTSGTSWIVLGGLLTLVSVAVMIPMLGLAPAGAAGVGIVLVVFLYSAMLVSRRVTPGVPRLTTLAVLMIAIAVVALVTVGVVAATEWGVLG